MSQDDPAAPGPGDADPRRVSLRPQTDRAGDDLTDAERDDLHELLESRRLWRERWRGIRRFGGGVAGTVIAASLVSGTPPPFVGKLWSWILSWLDWLNR